MKSPEGFLKQQYWSNEKFRDATEETADRTKRREEENVPNEPEARVENYLRRFTDILDREDERGRERGKEAIKRLLKSKYVINPENISDGYIKGILLGNFAERKGYDRGDLRDSDIKEGILEQFQSETGEDLESYTIPDQERESVREMAVKDQEARINSWFDYLTSEEANNVPAAYRYWAFAEMLKLGSYDDERNTYNKRTETTAAPFPELDQQALALVLDEIRKKQADESSGLVLTQEQGQDEFRKRLNSQNFGKLYAFIQEHLKTLRFPSERLIITDGEWKVFPKGSNAKDVVEALSGFHTQWCIAGEGTAEGYLSHSDLHIYFSEDQDGDNAIPRACIVSSPEEGITEVRGIMSDENAKQHLDDYIIPVVDEHLESLPDGEKWREKMNDMKRLADIHIRHSQREPLEKDDLRFLYEIDHKIQGTGYDQDPRVSEILQGRDIKDDLSIALGVPKERISTTREEALSGDISYHYGHLSLRGLTSAEGLTLPQSIRGYLYLDGLTSAEGLTLPQSIGGSLSLDGLTSAKGLTLPQSIGGGLSLRGLTSAEGLTLPQSIGGYLYLDGLTSAEGLTLPQSIGGDLSLRGLTSAEGLTLPQSIGGDLYLNGLTSAEGLTLPQSIGGVVIAGSLSVAEKERLRAQYPSLDIR